MARAPSFDRYKTVSAVHQELIKLLSCDYLIEGNNGTRAFLIRSSEYLQTPSDRQKEKVEDVLDALRAKGVFGEGNYGVLKELTKDIDDKIDQLITEAEEKIENIKTEAAPSLKTANIDRGLQVKIDALSDMKKKGEAIAYTIFQWTVQNSDQINSPDLDHCSEFETIITDLIIICCDSYPKDQLSDYGKKIFSSCIESAEKSFKAGKESFQQFKEQRLPELKRFITRSGENWKKTFSIFDARASSVVLRCLYLYLKFATTNGLERFWNYYTTGQFEGELNSCMNSSTVLTLFKIDGLNFTVSIPDIEYRNYHEYLGKNGMMAMSKSVNFANAQRPVPCDACEDEIPGEYYCIECKQTLCPPCEKFHDKFTKGHNIVLRTQVGDVDTTTLTCTDHGSTATYHCEKCNVPVCGRCITGKHQGHKMVDLTTILEKERKKLQDDAMRMKNDVLPKLKKRKEEITTEKENYKIKIKRIAEDMEDEKKEIDRIHNERMKTLISIRESRLSTFDNYLEDTDKEIQKVQKTLAEYKEVIRKSSLPTIIGLIKRKDPLPEIGRKVDLPNAPVYVPGNLHSVLGKLQVSSPPPSVSEPLKLTTPTIVSQFKCPLQGDPSICISKEGDVWLGGLESRELVMVDVNGKVLRRRSTQNRPYSLDVMDCGEVIISPREGDSSSVSRLLRDGRKQHLYETSPSKCNGVSVTADQKILICTRDGRVVRINGDGTNVKQIYKGSGILSAIHAVEDTDGNIYISDFINNAVVKVNKDGQVLSTITHSTGGQQLGGPWGLVMDKMENILCADYTNNCVYIIDQNQRMRELLVRSHGIFEPRWLAVDNDNNLWVTQNDGNVQIVKYLSP